MRILSEVVLQHGVNYFVGGSDMLIIGYCFLALLYHPTVFKLECQFRNGFLHTKKES